MTSLRQLVEGEAPRSASVGLLAGARGLTTPFSVLDLQSITITTRFSAEAPVAGEVTCSATRAGDVVWSGQVRNGKMFAFDFLVSARLVGDTGLMSLPFRQRGEVGGTVDGGPRVVSLEQRDVSPSMPAVWSELAHPSLEVTVTTELGGTTGDLAELARDVLAFGAASSLAGVPAASVLLLAGDVDRLSGLAPARAQWSRGVLLTSGILMLCGPTLAVPAYVGGLLVDDLDSFDMRPLHAAERDYAEQVFAASIPYERVRITNAENRNPRKDKSRPSFVPLLDGVGAVNVGPRRYHSMTDDLLDRQALVHELTHFWQWLHDHSAETYLDKISHGLKGDHDWEDYDYGTGDAPWRDLHREAQAAAIGDWAVACDGVGLRSAQAEGHPLFHYVEDVIRVEIA